MSFEVSWITLAVIALTAAVALWIAWSSWSRSGYSFRVGMLELLRLALVGGGSLTLLQPEYVETIKPVRQSVVAILYDVSKSMQTSDVEVAGELTSRENAMAAIKDPNAWTRGSHLPSATADRGSLLPNATADRGSLLPSATADKPGTTKFTWTPFSSELDSSDEGTDIESALRKATDGVNDVRAIVLASDGDWNLGGSPAQAAQALRVRDIPVYTIAVGDSKKLPDLEIAGFDVPTFAVVGKPLRIPFAIQCSLDRDTDVAVELILPGGEVQRQNVRALANGLVRETLEWRPKRVGDEKITLRIPLDPSERVVDNNEQTVAISLRYESLKVLMIDSYPRWEYRYTRNALLRDPGVEVHCYLLHPDIGEVGDGAGYLNHFPSADELAGYDVVFLGDVGMGPDELTTEQCQMLRQLIESQAGGLVLMPGFRGKQSTLKRSPLDDLFPVDLDMQSPKGVGSQRPSHFLLTESGRASLLTRLESDDRENEEIW
ncbi:MAG: hypothetical protein ABL921_09910, partial [Pirellula sp.]